MLHYESEHDSYDKLQAFFCALLPLSAPRQAFATFNTVIEFIVDWVARIGLVVGFIGAVQFALGFKDDSADGKT